MQKVVAALTVAPLLACVLLQLLHVEAYEISRGDVATIELRVLHAMRFEQALGPYARFGVSHPGPLLFYVLAPIYALSGRVAGSMYVVAAAINLAATIGLVHVVWTRVTGTLPRAAVLLGVALLLGALMGAHQPLGLATPWNPFVTIVPFGLLLVLVAAADSPSRAWVFGVVALHAFAAQSHSMYLVPATVALALALVWRRNRRDTIVSAVLVAVLWLPTAIDEIAGTHNLRAVAGVASGHARVGLTFAETWSTLVDRLAFGSSLLLVVLVLALAASRWRLRAEPQTFRARLVVVAIVMLAAATIVVARLDAPRGYLVAWLGAIAFVAWLAVALAWLPAELPGRARMLPIVVAALAACGSGYHQLHVATVRMRKLDAAKPARTADVLRLLDEYASLSAGEPALLINRAPREWSTFVALALQLHKRGVPFVVEPKWTHMMGEAIPHADEAARTIEMVERDDAVMLVAK